MITESRTSWRKVCAIHAIIPSPPGLSAALSPRSAMMAKAYAHHIDPTTRVMSTAIFALTPSTSPIAALILAGVGCTAATKLRWRTGGCTSCAAATGGTSFAATTTDSRWQDGRNVAPGALLGQRDNP